MKIKLSILFFYWLHAAAFAQSIPSGEYAQALKLAYNPQTNKLTGVYENATGWDDATKAATFSCNFYFEGTLTGDELKIKSYYPDAQKGDIITGTLEIRRDKTIRIKLQSEHGGCWNVQHFVDEPVSFQLEKKTDWTQIRYVTAEKAPVCASKNGSKPLKTPLAKGTIVCVTKETKDFAYCIFQGEKTIKGWVKLSDLNALEP